MCGLSTPLPRLTWPYQPANSMIASTNYLSNGQSSVIQTNDNGVQSVAAGSEAHMRAIINSFKGQPVSLYDANTATDAIPMYFHGVFAAGRSIWQVASLLLLI